MSLVLLSNSVVGFGIFIRGQLVSWNPPVGLSLPAFPERQDLQVTPEPLWAGMVQTTDLGHSWVVCSAWSPAW